MSGKLTVLKTTRRPGNKTLKICTKTYDSTKEKELEKHISNIEKTHGEQQYG